MENKRYCLALDLVDDPEKIQQYLKHHQKIWPEVAQNLRDSGVKAMQIWRIGTRLFMIMDVDESYTPERADRMAMNNPKVQEWETLMWNYQLPTPWTQQGQKWVAMEKMFDLSQQA